MNDQYTVIIRGEKTRLKKRKEKSLKSFLKMVLLHVENVFFWFYHKKKFKNLLIKPYK